MNKRNRWVALNARALAVKYKQDALGMITGYLEDAIKLGLDNANNEELQEDVYEINDDAKDLIHIVMNGVTTIATFYCMSCCDPTKEEAKAAAENFIQWAKENL